MGTLRLCERRSGDEPVRRADGYRLLGEVDWLLMGSREEMLLAMQDLSGICERLSEEVALLSFGNAVGYFVVRGLGVLEVVSGKWGRDDFERMLAELTEIGAGLPFTAGA